MKNEFSKAVMSFIILTILILSMSTAFAGEDGGLNDKAISQTDTFADIATETTENNAITSANADNQITNDNTDNQITNDNTDNQITNDNTDNQITDDNANKDDTNITDNNDDGNIPKYGVNIIPVQDTGDDAADIQTAINTALDNYIISLGDREYDIGYSQININKNITFSGTGSTVIKGYGYTEGYGNSSLTSMFYITSSGVRMEGIRFENLEPNLAYTDWDTLYGWAVKISSTAAYVSVNNCSFINFNHGIYTAGRHTTITNSYFNGTTTRLFKYDTGGKERGTKGIHLESAANCLIANNTFDGPVLDAILLEYDCKGTKILDNEFINNSYSIYIYGDSDNYGYIIANNTFTDCGHYENYDYKGYDAVFNLLPIINAEETYIYDLTITNNTFYLRNATIVMSTPEYYQYIYGKLNITSNKFMKVSDDVNPYSIALLYSEAGTMKQLGLNDPIYITNNEYIEGMYLGIFYDTDDYGKYESWSSYFGDLVIPASGKATLLDLSVNDTVARDSTTANIKFTDENLNGLSSQIVLIVESENGIESYKLDAASGEASEVLSNLAKGSYTAIAAFGGNSTHFANYTMCNFTVKGKKSFITLDYNDEITSGEAFSIAISLFDEDNNGITGKVLITLNNRNHTVNITEGRGQLSVNDLIDEGIYALNVVFSGDNEYDNASAEGSIVVNAKESSLKIISPKSIISGETLQLNLTLVDLDDNPISGEVFVTVNNNTSKVVIKNGKGSIDINDLLEMGNYTITAKYYGDSSSINSTALRIIEVLGRETSNSISIEEIEYKKYSVRISLVNNDEKLNDTIEITLDGNIYKTIDLKNGEFIFIIDSLDAGDHIIKSIYNGSKIYLPSSDSKVISVPAAQHITVNPNDYPDDASAIQDAINHANPGDIIDLGSNNYADISDINITKNLTITSQGATIFTKGDSKPVFNVKNDGNIGFFNISNVKFLSNNGDVIVSYVNTGSDEASITISNITVEKVNSKVDASTICLISFNSTVPDSFESSVVLEGNELASGMKTSSVIYTKPVEPVISKKSTKIVCSNMKTTAIDIKVDGKKGSYFTVALKDTNNNVIAGKSVKITYQGNTYTVTTDSKGIARIQVNYAKAGTYKIAISFSGDSNYMGSSASAKVTVLKQSPKLKASAKKFKVKSKTKKLTATLKTSRGKVLKGKKVKFTIKGKTYTAKTNKKGIATVKIKLSKKGTYSCKIKTVADATYKSVNKKIKVKIK